MRISFVILHEIYFGNRFRNFIGNSLEICRYNSTGNFFGNSFRSSFGNTFSDTYGNCFSKSFVDCFWNFSGIFFIKSIGNSSKNSSRNFFRNSFGIFLSPLLDVMSSLGQSLFLSLMFYEHLHNLQLSASPANDHFACLLSNDIPNK